MIEHHGDDAVSLTITAFSRPATRLGQDRGTARPDRPAADHPRYLRPVSAWSGRQEISLYKRSEILTYSRVACHARAMTTYHRTERRYVDMVLVASALCFPPA